MTIAIPVAAVVLIVGLGGYGLQALYEGYRLRSGPNAWYVLRTTHSRYGAVSGMYYREVRVAGPFVSGASCSDWLFAYGRRLPNANMFCKHLLIADADRIDAQ